MQPTVRDEAPGDVRQVHVVNEQAFGRPTEADLVDRLRTNCPEALSLVAEMADSVVGHILFTPITLETGGAPTVGMALAPVAVLPAHQRQGIGGLLIEAGLDRLRRAGCPYVIVLGHTGYYPRFGFRPASRRDIRCQWDVPDEAFMVLVLDEKRMGGATGLARYRPEFADLA